MNTLDLIKNHPVYKQILSDSYGGIIYNVANRHKYDTLELLALWHSLNKDVQQHADGIITGVFNFIQE